MAENTIILATNGGIPADINNTHQLMYLYNNEKLYYQEMNKDMMKKQYIGHLDQTGRNDQSETLFAADKKVYAQGKLNQLYSQIETIDRVLDSIKDDDSQHVHKYRNVLVL